jgi:hypothetical protein
MSDGMDPARWAEAEQKKRERFEQWISAPPYEREIKRKPDDPTVTAWPGNYQDYNVQLAWEAWQEALRS